MSVINFPANKASRQIPEIKAVAAFALWQTKRFDTMDIAAALDLPEPAIMFLIDLFRDVKNGGAG